LLTVFFYQATGLWAAAALPASTPALAAAWFWWLCTLTALNDVAQFVTGKCLGQHKIAPTISPHKTWQGLVGGLLASALLAVGMGMALDLAPWPQLIGLGGVLGAVGFVGDMVLSAVKRRLGIKDFSQLIPGHGGILDRVDSLVLTAPTLCVWLHLHHAG
jgi:phosphatidate cytidylyltransferase